MTDSDASALPTDAESASQAKADDYDDAGRARCGHRLESGGLCGLGPAGEWMTLVLIDGRSRWRCHEHAWAHMGDEQKRFCNAIVRAVSSG